MKMQLTVELDCTNKTTKELKRDLQEQIKAQKYSTAYTCELYLNAHLATLEILKSLESQLHE